VSKPQRCNGSRRALRISPLWVSPETENTNATELTIRALRQLGRLEAVDDATVGLAPTTAQALGELSGSDPARIGPVARVHPATCVTCGVYPTSRTTT
jgi:hypothetical protein